MVPEGWSRALSPVRWVVLAAVLGSAGDAFADTPPVVRGPIAARIDTFMTRIAESGLQGTLLVERDGRVILHRGYGTVDRASGRRAAPDTPYHIGSLGKQFTATAILKLESAGRLRTTDSLPQWFANVPPDKQRITIDDLLHHSSGLPFLPRGDFGAPLPMDTLVREILSYPLSFEPGRRYQYSSPAYNLLAVIVEKASGQRFHEYLHAALWRPAGMTGTSGEDDSARWRGPLRTPSYSGAEADPPIYPVRGRSKSLGAGSVVSTAGDLYRWELALRSGAVLDAAATAKLFAPAVRVSPTGEYANGWNVVRSQRNTTVIMHGGDLGGFNVDMRRLVDEHATIIFLSNARDAGRGYRDPVSWAVTRFLFGPPPEMPPARITLSANELAKWNTWWSVAEGETVWTVVRDRQVYARARSPRALAMIAGSDSAGRAQEVQLATRSDSVSAWLASGDLAAAAHALDASLPDGAQAHMVTLWRGRADALGRPVRLEVLGTAGNGPGSGTTLVRMIGFRGSEVFSLDWVRGYVSYSEIRPEGVIELPFVTVSPRRLARFDLWSGRTAWLERPDQLDRSRP
jgi:CubicO group peptidase (beta-lactamase class C family)